MPGHSMGVAPGRLCAGLIGLAGLADDDSTRADNENLFEVVATWHGEPAGDEVNLAGGDTEVWHRYI